jgi:hypothetical protein
MSDPTPSHGRIRREETHFNRRKNMAQWQGNVWQSNGDEALRFIPLPMSPPTSWRLLTSSPTIQRSAFRVPHSALPR